jgi:hypothetical protein
MADIGGFDTVAFLESPAFELVFADFRNVMTQNQTDRILDFDCFVHASILKNSPKCCYSFDHSLFSSIQYRMCEYKH